MGNTAVMRLNKRGGLTLPPDLRRELLPGTEFVVRRQDRNILLLPKQTTAYDLSAEAGSFANALVSEGYADYTVQMALTECRWRTGGRIDGDGCRPALPRRGLYGSRPLR